MKRYRIYTQKNARLRKIKGNLPLYVNGEKLAIKGCGYDSLDEAKTIINYLLKFWDKDQFCIIDFDTGLIEEIL